MSSMVRWRWVMPSLSSRTIQSWCSRLCTRCDPLSHRLSAPSCFKENDNRVPVPVLLIIKFVRYLNNKECWRNGPSTWYKLSCVAACFWADTILFQTKNYSFFVTIILVQTHIFKTLRQNVNLTLFKFRSLKLKKWQLIYLSTALGACQNYCDNATISRSQKIVAGR